MISILYTLPENSNPNEISLITQFFELGLDVLHVRKPKLNSIQLEEFIKKIPTKYHKNIIIHSHYSLIDVFDLKGIHFTEKNKSLEYFQKLKVRRLRRKYKNIFLSAAFHSLKDLAHNQHLYDYVTLSPIFKSISKKDYVPKSAIKLRDIEDYLRKKKVKIIALGGVNKEKITLIKEVGFYGYALLGAIWESENPIEYFKEIKCITDQKEIDPFFL